MEEIFGLFPEVWPLSHTCIHTRTHARTLHTRILHTYSHYTHILTLHTHDTKIHTYIHNTISVWLKNHLSHTTLHHRYQHILPINIALLTSTTVTTSLVSLIKSFNCSQWSVIIWSSIFSRPELLYKVSTLMIMNTHSGTGLTF